MVRRWRRLESVNRSPNEEGIVRNCKPTALIQCVLWGVLLISMAALPAEGKQVESLVAEAMSPIRQAISTVSMGLHSLSSIDRRVNAQAVLNLLLGEEDAAYDSEIGSVLGFPTGLQPHFAQLDAQAFSGTPEQQARFEDDLSRLRLSAPPMLGIVSNGLTQQEAEDAFLTTLALLTTVYADFQDLLEEWGYEIWVNAGESIQAAIDQAWDHAIIRVEAGIYRETLEITRSVALFGVGNRAVIEPVGGQDGVIIRTTANDIVLIKDIDIRGASTGASVSGESVCTVEDLGITGCLTAIEGLELSDVTARGAHLEGNETAVHASGRSSVTLSDCRIAGSQAAFGAIVAVEYASVRVEDCGIKENSGNGAAAIHSAMLAIHDSCICNNGGDGILVTETARLDLVGSRIAGNGGFGLRAISDLCPHEDVSPIDPFTGTITGRDNVFGEAGSGDENGLGWSCPSSLEYLR